MRTFTINGRLYRSVPFTFNTICDLEEMGIRIEDAQKKPMSLVRGYFTLCSGGDREFAGGEIQAHLLAGGSLNQLSEAMAAEMNESDFFHSLSTPETEETGTEEKPKRARK